MASPTVEDRLAERRGRLQPFCHVDSVKQHLRLPAYHQLARQLFQQMESYVQEEQWDQAYVYLARFVKLCSKVIPAHADYQNPKYEKERKWISTQAENGLKLFDIILKGMEESELELMAEERENEHRQLQRLASAEKERSASWTPPPPTYSQHVTLEDKFAALRPRKAQDEQARAAITESADPPRLRSSYPGLRSNRTTTPRSPPEQKAAKASAAYPTVSKAHWMQDSLLGSAAASVRRPRRQLSRQSSKEVITQLSSGQLRQLEIPTFLVSEFTAIAAPNTTKYPDGIETCGILAGKLHGSKLVVTTLIIPKQEGSSDMCTMKNEEELFDFCFGNDLLTLGWIHTHPRQNCFLSSVDIHTQCGFQSILPEAIAIVVAPSDTRRNVGVFRLTEPAGMQLIQQCTLKGFHMHPENVQIYSDALACEWDARSKPRIVDMR